MELQGARLEKKALPKKGYFKKYVYLWKGDFIFNVKKIRNLQFENANRFRIVNLAIPDSKWRKSLLKKGVIRILEGQSSDIQPVAAYHQWLKRWIKEKRFAIYLIQDKTDVGYIFFDQTSAKYIPKADFFKLPLQLQDNYGDYLKSELRFAHHKSMKKEDQSKIVRIRSHGALSEKFFQNVHSVENFKDGKITSLALYELIEVIKTKVCIFDKRIVDRIPSDKLTLLKTQLNCDIFGEKIEEWEQIKAEGLGEYHFIVIHLSFIEAMNNRKNQRYGEEGIVDFIEEQLPNLLAKNCILVITTGRGRIKWSNKIQKSKYAIHTTLRPVESLIEAVEKAILKKDDIEVKYNLIKVLFGS